MNKNLIIGLVIILLLIGGVVLIQNNSTNQNANVSTGINESEIDNPDTSLKKSNEDEDAIISNGDNTVTLTDDGFSPKSITIKVGEKVTWLNNSGDKATVDSSVHPTHRDYPKLNLGLFDDGEEKSLVFDESGTYKYHDHLNASKTGTVVVE